MTARGGMYIILGLIGKILDDTDNIYINIDEVHKVSGLSRDAISKNLCRLVNANLLEREDDWIVENGTVRRCTRYKLRKGVKNFIRENLYGFE